MIWDDDFPITTMIPIFHPDPFACKVIWVVMGNHGMGGKSSSQIIPEAYVAWPLLMIPASLEIMLYNMTHTPLHPCKGRANKQ